MRIGIYTRLCLVQLIAVCLPVVAFAQTGHIESVDSSGKNLSPYFLVTTGVEGQDILPLRSTNAKVSIVGVIADVTVTQVYQNTSTTAIEAIYVFPGSTRSAVHGMKMSVGDRVTEAKIKERLQANIIYKEAKQQGKTASILEQHRPNLFQMSIANILPNDVVKVELRYTELLVPTEGIYEFIYPTVVGPRYSSLRHSSSVHEQAWNANPYTSQGVASSYAFNFDLELRSAVPIKDVLSSSHDVDISYSSSHLARVALKETGKSEGNRDLVLKYRLDGNEVSSGVVLQQGEKENFFLLMVQPPEKVRSEQIPGREYIFIVDVSGSMNGFPLETAKQLLKNLVGSLRPTDYFNVILFAGTSALLSPQSLPATEDNIKNALALINEQRGSGGTELISALKKAIGLPRLGGDLSRSMVMITDGYIDMEIECFDLIDSNLGSTNLFAFGIGSTVNRYLIEGLARVGGGEPFVVTNPEQAQKEAERFRHYIETPVLTNIRADFQGFEVSDLQPQNIPDLFADRPIVVSGKWKNTATGYIRITGQAGGEKFESRIPINPSLVSSQNKALSYLWARTRIAELGDYNSVRENDERINEITSLGLTYNLLTKYTSFIAVDDIVRNSSGNQQTVKQPLPLPQGVSDMAIGNWLPTTPEPEEYALILVLGAVLLFQVRKSYRPS